MDTWHSKKVQDTILKFFIVNKARINKMQVGDMLG